LNATANTTLVHTAFYKFVLLADAGAVAARLRELAAEFDIKGSVIVADEGINGVVAGTMPSVEKWEQSIMLEPLFNGAFSDVEFKRSQCITAPFSRMKVSHKKAIVAFGVVDAVVEANDSVSAQMLDPKAWRELIAQDDVVVLDNRNSFEFRLGRFHNAVDPQVANFRDFADYVEAHAAQWKAEGKRVAMYCTGGIRCERAGGWMQHIGVPVYQLHGGILNYFQAMPDAEKDWDGECFVFDNRVAINTKLNETETTIDTVYEAETDGEFRIARAQRLMGALQPAVETQPTLRLARRERNHDEYADRVIAHLRPRTYTGAHVRDGVNASCVALPGDVSAWPMVINFLSYRFENVSRETWQQRITDGDVIDEAGHKISIETRSKAHQKIYYFRSVNDEPRIPFSETIVYRDEWIVVADKPHFLPVVPSGHYVQETLLTRLKKTLGIGALSPIHRIDRDTAGLVIFSIQAQTRDAYQRLFREHRMQKMYEAIAPFSATLTLPTTYCNRMIESEKFMQMTAIAGEANAQTQIEIIERQGDIARYALRPRTGQKHQLRMHMAALGIAIVNDRIYPTLQPFTEMVDYSTPLQLLAKSIAFTDPMTGVMHHFESAQRLHFSPLS
jgi:predicted sulfurtransferase/23S rRNA-/tRNA-specific pseudouridylate synthase